MIWLTARDNACWHPDWPVAQKRRFRFSRSSLFPLSVSVPRLQRRTEANRRTDAKVAYATGTDTTTPTVRLRSRIANRRRLLNIYPSRGGEATSAEEPSSHPTRLPASHHPTSQPFRPSAHLLPGTDNYIRESYARTSIKLISCFHPAPLRAKQSIETQRPLFNKLSGTTPIIIQEARDAPSHNEARHFIPFKCN